MIDPVARTAAPRTAMDEALGTLIGDRIDGPSLEFWHAERQVPVQIAQAGQAWPR
jgi:hypothetical protein